MLKVWLTTRSSAGFSLVEALLAAAVFSVLTMGLVGAVVYGRASTANAGDRVRANMLAEEGVEAVRNIRDASYANLTDGTYGLAQSGGAWTLSGSSDTSGIFTRHIAIGSSGANRKTVTSTVTWAQGGGTATASASGELTNWLAALTVPKSWRNAILAGSANTSGANSGVEVATQGNYAYMVHATGTAGLAIIDISNPASPTVTGTLSLSNSPTNIFVSGNYAYITTTNDSAELQIVNISNPASPSLVASYNAPGNADGLGVSVSGSYAYLARAANSGTNEFIILNISNPASPALVGSYGNNISMEDVTVSGNYAYVGTNSSTQELLVINVSLPILPVLAATYNLTTSGTVNTMARSGNTLYLAQASTLSIVDITNPLAASRLGTLTATNSATINDIAVDSTGTYAFLGTSNGTTEFQVADVSTPASASVVRTVDMPGSSQLKGVAYNAGLDEVAGASTDGTGEGRVFTPN